MKAALAACYAVAIASVALCAAAIVSSASSAEWGGVAGMLATILSVALALFSIVYTRKTNEDTSKLLGEIRSQNLQLVDKINQELTRDNYDEANIGHALDRYGDGS